MVIFLCRYTYTYSINIDRSVQQKQSVRVRGKRCCQLFLSCKHNVCILHSVQCALAQNIYIQIFGVCAQLCCSLQDRNNIQNTVNPLSGRSTHYIHITPVSSPKIVNIAVCMAHNLKTLCTAARFSPIYRLGIQKVREKCIQYSDRKIQ